MKAQDVYKKMMNSPGVSGAQKQRFVRKLGKDEKSFMSAIKEDMYYSEDGKNGKCDYCDNAEAHSHKIDDADFAGGQYRKPNMKEALVGKQVKLDKNYNGKLDGQDFKILKAAKKQKLPQGAYYAAQRRKERLAANGRMDEAEASVSKIQQHLAKKDLGVDAKNHKSEYSKMRASMGVDDKATTRKLVGEIAVSPAMRRAQLIAKMAKHSPKFAAAMAKPKPAEDKKVEEATSDNTDSRLTPKIDMLLRLGLVSADSINRYRAALRGGEKSLANPELRRRLSDLLDRLLDLSTQDPQTFNRMRTTIRDTNPMREAVQSALDTKHDSEQDAMSIRQAREKANAVARNTVSRTVKKELKDEVQLSDSALNNLNEKAIKHNIDIDIILEVYARGINAWSDSSRKLTREQWAFNRVNSFLSGGQTQAVADADLWERASGGGEFGSDELRRNYSNATPGQKEEVILASFSARKPWVGPNEENTIDTGKTPKTYQDIRKAISGIREEG